MKKVKPVGGSSHNADGGLPAGSSDDVGGGHGGRGGVGVVEHEGVVGVVLLHGPQAGVLNGVLLFQLRDSERISFTVPMERREL